MDNPRLSYVEALNLITSTTSLVPRKVPLAASGGQLRATIYCEGSWVLTCPRESQELLGLDFGKILCEELSRKGQFRAEELLGLSWPTSCL